MNLFELRENYKKNILDESMVGSNPLDFFKIWLQEAISAKIPEPNAMNVATVGENGQPHSRIVLVKKIVHDGLMFFTNYKSNKGEEVKNNNKVSICFHWVELERQVRIQGTIVKTSEAESDEYFFERPFASQVGAWSSDQSQKVKSRQELEDRFQEKMEYFKTHQMTRPSWWGGYLVRPELYEFWQGRESRLHDRIQFKRENKGWAISRLSP